MKDKVGDEVRFISEGLDCEVTLYNGIAIGIELPASVVLQITESEPGIKGDTASGAAKPAKLSTGAVGQRAPLHQGGRVGEGRHAHRAVPRAGEQVTGSIGDAYGWKLYSFPSPATSIFPFAAIGVVKCRTLFTASVPPPEHDAPGRADRIASSCPDPSRPQHPDHRIVRPVARS